MSGHRWFNKGRLKSRSDRLLQQQHIHLKGVGFHYRIVKQFLDIWFAERHKGVMGSSEVATRWNEDWWKMYFAASLYQLSALEKMRRIIYSPVHCYADTATRFFVCKAQSKWPFQRTLMRETDHSWCFRKALLRPFSETQLCFAFKVFEKTDPV